MTLTPSFQFIDEALFEATPFELSYKDPDQKWVIRNHLIGLIQDFPCLVPSTDTFVHSDGTCMNLLNVSGYLSISSSLPDIPIIIWVHENYPLMPPMVFILRNQECPIHQNHPFIDDKSGFVTPPNVLFCDDVTLCDFVQNLVNLFQFDHPSMPSFVEKKAVLDELVGKIDQDIATLELENGDAIEKWSNVQGELRVRADIVNNFISKLEEERAKLEINVGELNKYNESLLGWLRINSKNTGSKGQVQGVLHEKVCFVEADEESKLLLDCLSVDRALEDVIYALDKALEQGLVSFEAYMKQLRVLAREQFLQRAKLVRFKGGHILNGLF